VLWHQKSAGTRKALTPEKRWHQQTPNNKAVLPMEGGQGHPKFPRYSFEPKVGPDLDRSSIVNWTLKEVACFGEKSAWMLKS
jgi:hypothetical protein